VRQRLSRGHLRAALGVDNLGNDRHWVCHPCARRTGNAGLSAEM
jgi:hypothetical protein